ncbi:MAG: hypothetical protein LBQ93_08375 [Treponema sp.]|jgi:hypothetical protein|nr:hypothetical protein [Treponema sp.]
MKTALLMLTASIISISNISITGCANVRPANKNGDFAFALESGNFSNTGAIALHDSDYRFTVILVNNLEWALESLKIADYGLPHISRFKRGEKVTPFLTFMTFNNRNVDLTYSVKLQGPDGKSVEEKDNLPIARSTVSDSMGYSAQEFATMNFDETDALGTYQFHIIIRDGENTRNACIMQFELTE